MPLYTSEALILRTYKLAEADRIVVFLTRDRGKKRGVAKGARRPRSRFVGSLEPLTRVAIAYFEKERRELVSLNYAEALQSPLRTHVPDALGYVGYFAELIDECAPEADPNETLFRLGASVLDALTAGSPVDRVMRYFEYWVLRLQGVYPHIRVCPACAGDLTDGAVIPARDRVFVCRRCAPRAGGRELSREAIAFLRGAAVTAPERLAALPLPSHAARQLEHAHRALIATHLEKELRSTRVLKGLGR
jgi:DNA repair protein RecO (recombination protein O)